MTGPMPYIHFPGTTRAALTFYGDQVIDRYGLHWLIGFEGDDDG